MPTGPHLPAAPAASAAPAAPSVTGGPAVTLLLCRDLGAHDDVRALAGLATGGDRSIRALAVDDLCGHPRRLSSTAAGLHLGRTVVVCRRGPSSAADIRRALEHAGVRPGDIVIADLGSRRRHHPAATAAETADRIRAALAEALTMPPAPRPAEPARCRSCGRPLGSTADGPAGARYAVNLAAVAARLSASHPAIADRLRYSDRCADCLLVEGSGLAS